MDAPRPSGYVPRACLEKQYRTVHKLGGQPDWYDDDGLGLTKSQNLATRAVRQKKLDSNKVNLLWI